MRHAGHPPNPLLHAPGSEGASASQTFMITPKAHHGLSLVKPKDPTRQRVAKDLEGGDVPLNTHGIGHNKVPVVGKILKSKIWAAAIRWAFRGWTGYAYGCTHPHALPPKLPLSPCGIKSY